MPTTDTASKVCSLCHQSKPLEAFAKRTRSADGLQRHCKACGRAALDAADARQRALRIAARAGVVTDRETLEDRLALRAAAVVDLLFDCAEEGAADVLSRLADLLCGPYCPAAAEDYAGEECLPHWLGDSHTDTLYDRVPAAVAAMSSRNQAGCAALAAYRAEQAAQAADSPP